MFIRVEMFLSAMARKGASSLGTWTFVASLISQVLCIGDGHAETRIKTVSADEVCALGAEVEDVQELVKQADQDSFVVFLPGILGSKLSIGGRDIWGGSKTKPILSDIVLDTNSTVEAKVMDSYPAILRPLGRQDVYGEFDELLASVIAGYGNHAEFPYDWRRDIEAVADDFESWLRHGPSSSELKGKRVYIVAHSTGGLVAWQWKNKYLRRKGENPYEFTVSRLVLVGVPLQGSCEMLRMLLLGYRPYPGASLLEDSVYKLLFRDLRAAAYTWQSVFELLPRPTADMRSCVVLDSGVGPTPANHFSIRVWDESMPGIGDVASQLKIERSEFLRRLSALLSRAEEFRKNLDLTEGPLEERVTYFYGFGKPTTSQISISGRTGKLKTKPSESTNGDGRVLFYSATNDPDAEDTPRSLQSSHGDLVRDGSFVRFIGDEIGKNVRRRLRDCALALNSSKKGRSLFAERGYLVGLSDLDENPLEGNPKSVTRKAISGLNSLTIAADVARSAEREGLPKTGGQFQVYEYAKWYDSQRDADPKIALALYETALSGGHFQAGTSKVYAQNRYGLALIKSTQFQSAVTVLTEAERTMSSSRVEFDEDFAAKLYNNLGVALKATPGGSLRARESLTRAAELGSEKAKHNLKAFEANDLPGGDFR